MFLNIDSDTCCNSVLLTSNGFTSDLEYDTTFPVHGAYVRETKVGRSSSGKPDSSRKHSTQVGNYTHIRGSHILFKDSQGVWVVSNNE